MFPHRPYSVLPLGLRVSLGRPCCGKFVFLLVSFTTSAALTKSANLRNDMLMAACVRSTLLILCSSNTTLGIRVSMDMLKAEGNSVYWGPLKIYRHFNQLSL